MALNCPKIKFYNGNEIPSFGLGTWKSKPGEVVEAVKYAIEIGYRHIDCAHVYGNEKEVGEALKAKMDDVTIKRDDIFITSKLWNTFHKQGSVESAIKQTLKDLGLDYIDLYLIHWPMAYEEGDNLFPLDADGKFIVTDTDYLETWKGMEGVLEKGLTKNIGVSNFNSEQIKRVLENCKVKPVTNQVECHPYLVQKELSKFCKNLDIVFTAYSPLGSPDRPWAKPGEPVLLEDPKLLEVCKKYDKTPAQVLIRYQLDRGHVVIPKSVTNKRILENAQVFDFKLADEDMKKIDTFDINGRICPSSESANSKFWPFNIPF